ncbi:hypothetical protein [Tsukamurella sp. NPDC003166]|uniref:hypothetical protein n=1 Tax=Tsukamurella sp. NPDC003166 TaxID=3154444 RepID=UPI0033A55EB5
MHSVTVHLDGEAPPAALARMFAPIAQWLAAEFGAFDHLVATARPGHDLRLELVAPAAHTATVVTEIATFLRAETGGPVAVLDRAGPLDPLPVRCGAPLLAAVRERPDESPLAHAVRALLAVVDLHPAGAERGTVSLLSHYEGLRHAVVPAVAAELHTGVTRWVDAHDDWLDEAVTDPLTGAWRSALHWCAGRARHGVPDAEPLSGDGGDDSGSGAISDFHQRVLPLVDGYHEPWFTDYRVVLEALYERVLPPLGIGVQLRAAAAGVVVEHARRRGWTDEALFEVFDGTRRRATIDSYRPHTPKRRAS